MMFTLSPDFPVTALAGRLKESLYLACAWLTDIAQMQQTAPCSRHVHPGYIYADWRGAIRSDYRADTRTWGFFCPYWHSAQAAKALLMAHARYGHTNYLHSAVAIGEFLMRNRISDCSDPDFGLLLAYEDLPHVVNISAVLESIDGLFFLSDATGDSSYENAALAALQWVSDKAYQDEEGLFLDFYDPKRRQFIQLGDYISAYTEIEKPRPLLDDGVFLKGYHRSGNARFRSIFFETTERLLATERPPGNWIHYGPCHEREDYIHPRHAYWWGAPMIDGWKESGDNRLLHAALRSAEWYSKALRRDGGFIRNTSLDFNTDSFGHATSGSACAAILLLRAATECQASSYMEPALRALNFCMKVQFTNPKDPNLKGAVLEKIEPPEGSDALPYAIRDLGTTFFIQAASIFLETLEQPSAIGAHAQHP